MTSFFIQVNLQGNPTNPGQASAYQLVAPWGQTDYCWPWESAVQQLFLIGSKHSGRMGMYFQLGTTNGHTTTVAGNSNANSIKATS